MHSNIPIQAADWAVAMLSQLCDLVSRGKAPQYATHSKVKVIGQRCVRETGFQGNEARFQHPQKIEGHLFAKIGDVLLNSTGTGTIGRSCVFDADSDYIVDGHVTIIRPNKEKCNSSLLNSICKTPWFQRHLEINCYTGSTNQIELSASAVVDIKICLPSIDEQNAIAVILDSVDDVIRRTEAVIVKLRLMKAGMLHDLLTRGIDENGELRDPICHPEHFNDSPLGKIPKEWKIKGLLEIASIVEGQVDPKLSPYADFILVAPDHIESATGRLLDSKTARQQGAISGKYLFSIGDVVYSKIRPYLRKVWLATFEGICSADMYPFRPTLEVDSQFLHMTLMSERFSIFAISVSERSGFPKINRKELSFFRRALPPKNEQERIVRAFKTVEERILKEQVAKDKILLLKQALMQDLLTGRVRVPQKLLEAMP